MNNIIEFKKELRNLVNQNVVYTHNPNNVQEIKQTLMIGASWNEAKNDKIILATDNKEIIEYLNSKEIIEFANENNMELVLKPHSGFKVY